MRPMTNIISNMIKLHINSLLNFQAHIRCCATARNINQGPPQKFETVFSFPFIKFISVLNRLKVYQMAGTSIALPGCGLMEILNMLPHQTFLTATYIGLTGTALLSLASLPFRNTIGFLYISEDNSHVKISSMDFWGRRRDKTITADEWVPLNDLPTKNTDIFYLTPHLEDGTQYKLFIKFGKILNSSKMGQVLE